jgi:predicted transcriptional regulator
MAYPYPKEFIQKIREEVLSGKSKHRVAKEMGIGKTTVYSHTIDIPSRNKNRPLNKEKIQMIRDEVLKGKSKYRIAKEMRLSFSVVYSYTRDLPNHVYRNSGIQGESIDLLKELLEKGYVNSNKDTHPRMRKLKRFLPMIQRAQIDGKSVYFLSDKNKIALQAMIKRNTSRIISYQELARMSKVFDIDLPIDEKNRFLGKIGQSNHRKRRKIMRQQESFSKECQSKIDDFFGRFLHSEVLLAGSSESRF